MNRCMRSGAHVLVAGCILLCGCKLSPRYAPPAASMAPSYKEGSPAMKQSAQMWVTAHPQDDAAKGNWWLAFHDPMLNALEDRVNSGNQTLAQYEAQYREARAAVRIAQSGLFPTITTFAQGVTESQSQNQTGVPSQLRIPGLNGTSNNNFQLAGTFSWEPDLWGSVRESIHAQKAGLQASAATLANVRLEIESEVATDYFNLRGQEEQIRILEQTVQQNQQLLNLTKDRFAGGVASEQDLTQAQTQLQSATVSLADAAISRASYEHAIAVLIGKEASSFAIEKATASAALPDLPAGVPAQMLQRRPDISASERQVAAANAQIGVQRAAFFPNLALQLQAGLAGNHLSNWFEVPSRFWSLGPSLTETVFDGNKRRGQVEQAKASYDATVATYRQAVLTAFQEVEDSLVSIRQLQIEQEHAQESVRSARRSYEIAEDRYQQGVESLVDVVTVQNALLTAQQTAATIDARRYTARVSLVKALGGSW